MIKLKYIIPLVAIILAGGFLYDGQNVESANVIITPQNLVQTIYDVTPDAPKSKSEIIKNFCNAVMTKDIISGFENKGFYYSPAKSIFLYMICKDFGKYKWFSELGGDDNIVLIETIPDLKNLKFMYKGACDPNTRMTNCDLGNYYHLLYEHIINDYINVKLANAYGYISSNTIKVNIASFVTKNFGDSKTICGGDDELLYINKSNLGGDDTAACSHPQTYKLLSKYIEGIADLVNNNAIIDYQAIINNKKCAKVTDVKKDFIACAITTTGSRFEKDASLGFMNIIQNEYFWYGLLNRYSKNYITLDLVNANLGTDSNKKTNFVKQEQYSLNFFANISRKSTDTSIDSLYQTIQKFPIHIGLIAYYEDVVAYRNKLAQLYTPLGELHYKLQNVQNKVQSDQK